MLCRISGREDGAKEHSKDKKCESKSKLKTPFSYVKKWCYDDRLKEKEIRYDKKS